MSELMELMTSVEKGNREVAFSQVSGLTRDQFATNSWGFPFIPIPQHREVSPGNYREAPGNITREYLPHPIFWIDHKLTKFDPDLEPEEQWCIRMYFVILAFDLWDSSEEGIRWVNILHNKNIIVDDLTFESYVQNSGGDFSATRCKLDNLENTNLPLEAKHFALSWDNVETQYYAVLAECDMKLQKSVDKFLLQQSKAINNAMLYLGEDADLANADLSADNPSGWWMKNIHNDLEEANQHYMFAFERGASKGKAAVLVQEIVEKLIHQLVIMDQTVAILNIPLVRTATTMSKAFSESMSYLKLAAYSNIKKELSYGFEDTIDKLFRLNKINVEDDVTPNLEPLMIEMFQQYQKSWNRIRLSVANYYQLQNNEPPFTNIEDLFMYLSSASIMTEYESEDKESDQVSEQINAHLSNLGVSQSSIEDVEHMEQEDRDIFSMDDIVDMDDDVDDDIIPEQIFRNK